MDDVIEQLENKISENIQEYTKMERTIEGLKSQNVTLRKMVMLAKECKKWSESSPNQ